MNARPARLRTATALLALVALALPLAGAQQEQAQGARIERDVFLHEGPLHILPERIEARVGDTLVLNVTNAGATPHNLIVCGDGQSVMERCEERWGFTPILQAEQTATVIVELKTAGTFDYYCSIAGHKSGGMTGTLHVAAADAGGKGVPAPGALAAALALVAAAALLAARPPRP